MKYIVIVFMLSFLSTAMSFDLPGKVKESIKKHCKGEVVAMEKESVKGFTVYAITAKEGKEKIDYFFSASGRLIHHDKKAGEEDGDRDEEDRLDRFEDEKEDDGDEEEEFDHDEDEEDGPETYEEIDKDKLPAAVKESIKKELGDTDFHVGRELVYIVETEVDGREIVLVYNIKGELVEKEVHDGEDEDKDDEEDGGREDDNEDEDEDEDEEDEDDEEDDK